MRFSCSFKAACSKKHTSILLDYFSTWKESFVGVAYRGAHEAAGEVGAASRKSDAADQPVAVERVHRLAAHLEGARAVPVPCALRSGQQMVLAVQVRHADRISPADAAAHRLAWQLLPRKHSRIDRERWLMSHQHMASRAPPQCTKLLASRRCKWALNVRGWL